MNFGTIETNFWRLTGSPPVTVTTSYPKCPGAIIRHLENHYASEFLFDSLQAALTDFFAWSGTPEGGGQFLKLGINDMSLPDGGLFDICSDWEPGHSYHRVGASVDIDRNAELFDQPGNFVGLSDDQVNQLTVFVDLHGGSRIDEESIHYGFGGI